MYVDGCRFAYNTQFSALWCGSYLDEYQNIVHHRVHSGEMMHMMQVVHHKTGVSGSAKVVLTQADFSKVNTYVTSRRPQLDPSKVCHNLLCLESIDDTSKPITKFSTRFAGLTKRYGLPAFTATTAHKLAATKAAICLDSASASLVTHQMSHCSTTHGRHYELLASTGHAAEAVSLMGKVRAVPQPPPLTETEKIRPPPEC